MIIKQLEKLLKVLLVLRSQAQKNPTPICHHSTQNLFLGETLYLVPLYWKGGRHLHGHSHQHYATHTETIQTD